MSRLSVGLLIGDREPSHWFTRSIQRLVSECDARVDQVIVPKPIKHKNSRSIEYYVKYALKNRCWAPKDFLNEIRGSRRMNEVRELRGEPITSVSGITKQNITTCQLESVGKYRVALPDKVVRELLDLDVIFHAGVGILSGSVLDAPKYGVWGVHHGDIRKYRGGPPGFWEYVNGEETGVITLQKYTEELDAGHVILEKTVDISSARTWPEVRKIMCRETIPTFMEGVSTHVRQNEPTYSVNDLGPIYTRSDRGCITLLKYLYRTIPGRIRTVWETSDHAGMEETSDGN